MPPKISADRPGFHPTFLWCFKFPQYFGFVPLDHQNKCPNFSKTKSIVRYSLFISCLVLLLLDNAYITLYLSFKDTSFIPENEWYDILVHTTSRSLGVLLGCQLWSQLDNIVYLLNVSHFLDGAWAGNGIH